MHIGEFIECGVSAIQVRNKQTGVLQQFTRSTILLKFDTTPDLFQQQASKEQDQAGKFVLLIFSVQWYQIFSVDTPE